MSKSTNNHCIVKPEHFLNRDILPTNGEIILVRGLPGSGKTTLAKSLLNLFDIEPEYHFEADHFFLTPAGEYKFEGDKLRAAHNWCQNSVRILLSRRPGYSPIVVSNTFTQRWELQPYVEIADEHNRDVLITQSNTDWAFEPEKCFEKCAHGVPLEKIQQMAERWEELDDIENFSR